MDRDPDATKDRKTHAMIVIVSQSVRSGSLSQIFMKISRDLLERSRSFGVNQVPNVCRTGTQLDIQCVIQQQLGIFEINLVTGDISNGILPYFNESTEYGLKDRKHKSQCSCLADVGRKG